MEFGRLGNIPGTGELQLQSVGGALVAKRVIRASSITGLSIQVNATSGNDYKLSIRKNGVTAGDEVASLALPSGSLGAHVSGLAVALAAGDILYAFLVRTSGAGASGALDMMAAEVEVTG